MFSKDWQTRWNETITYLNDTFRGVGIGDHINGIVPQNQRKTLFRQISLGKRSDGEDDPEYAQVTAQRKALRGLLLCQRVYTAATCGLGSPRPGRA